MKKLLWVILLMAGTTFSSWSQTQTGYVKTKGRLGSNGKVVSGTRLPGATVQVKGRNAVVTNANGAFSLPIPSNKYSLQTVKKNGYLLIDPDILLKVYSYSANPLIIAMQSPEQQQDDKLAAEKKLRRTLQRQLQAKEDELEALMEQNRVTQDEYRKALEALYEEQDKNGRLISEMAEHYSQVDYDQLDAFNLEVSDCILNGELVKADSLLRSKGDVDARIARIHEQEAAQATEQAELSRRQSNLDKSIAGTRAEKQDVALDCHNFFKKFVIECQHDSAACYIVKRANLDRDNIDWQFDAGKYFLQRGLVSQAEEYYRRTLDIARRQAQSGQQSHEAVLARTLQNAALLDQDRGRRTEAIEKVEEALGIYRRLAASSPELFELRVASALNSLALLHNDLDKSEALFESSLEILSRYVHEDARVYSSLVGNVLNNLGLLYEENQYAANSEQMYLNALDIYRHLAEANETAYLPDVANTLNNLSSLYHTCGFKGAEGEKFQQEAIQIYRRLAQDDPELYNPKLAEALFNLAKQCYDRGLNDAGNKACAETLDVYRWLNGHGSPAHKQKLAALLCEQGIRLYQQDRMAESLSLFEESLGLYREMAAIDPQNNLADVAKLMRNVANIHDKLGQLDEGGKMYEQELAINKQLAEGNPGLYAAHVARSYGNLSNHALLLKQFDKALEYARLGLACDSSKLYIHANVAAAYLFKGEYAAAESIYRQYMPQLRDTFLDDLSQFERQGVIPVARQADVEKIRQLLQQP